MFTRICESNSGWTIANCVYWRSCVTWVIRCLANHLQHYVSHSQNWKLHFKKKNRIINRAIMYHDESISTIIDNLIKIVNENNRVLVLTKCISNFEWFVISPSLIRIWATSRNTPAQIISNNISLGYTSRWRCRCRSNRHGWGWSHHRGGGGWSGGGWLRSGRGGAGDVDSQFLAQCTMAWKSTKIVMWSSRTQCNICWAICWNWNWAWSIAWIKSPFWYFSHTVWSTSKVKYYIKKKLLH